MPQVKMKLDNEVRVVEHYVSLRNLMVSGQWMAAERYFILNSLIENWQGLFKYTMSRKNCEVTKLILKLVFHIRVIQQKKMTPKEFGVEVSTLLRDFRDEYFQSNLALSGKENLASDKYQKNLAEYFKVNYAVESGLMQYTGRADYKVPESHWGSDPE